MKKPLPFRDPFGALMSEVGGPVRSYSEFNASPTVNSDYPLFPAMVPQNDIVTIEEPNGDIIGYTRPKKPISGIKSISHPATIFVRSLKDKKIKFQTNKFLIQSISKPRIERFQILETFGRSALYFFNERTKVYTFTGEAADALYDGWPRERYLWGQMLQSLYSQHLPRERYLWGQMLQSLYSQHLRATELAKQDYIAILSADRFMVHGYPVQLNISKTADRESLVAFSMTWIVTKEILMDESIIQDAYNSPITQEYQQWLAKYLDLFEKQNNIIRDINVLLRGEYDESVYEAKKRNLKEVASEIKAHLEDKKNEIHLEQMERQEKWD